MTSEHWIEKLDAYFDGELPPDEARQVDVHLRECSTCAAEGVRRVQQKRAVHSAGQRFTPDPAFRSRMEGKIIGAKPSSWKRRWLPALLTATAALLMVSVVIFNQRNREAAEQHLVSELIDQHVATLASANPVDVVSTDRHTVKPWFEGKIPFTFNLPELSGTPFVLVGGRVSYLAQAPGAQLIFRIRQHQISVFVFQEQQIRDAGKTEAALNAHSFGVRSWDRDGLRYFVVGDASPEDLDRLSQLLKSTG